MTPQDSQLLQDFLNQLVQARGVAKDPQAEEMINRAASQQPDAVYLLVQRALLMQQALNNAKQEIATLQGQLRNGAPQAQPSFLDPNTWGNSGSSRPSASQQPQMPPPYQQPYQQPQSASMQAQQAPASGGGFLSGRGGSILGNVAATAAGVAGGAFLFQGLEHLLGAHAGNGFLGPQSALMSRPEETTIVNNYYEDTNRDRDRNDRSNLFDDSDRGSDSNSLLSDNSDNSGNSDFDNLGPDDDSLFT